MLNRIFFTIFYARQKRQSFNIQKSKLRKRCMTITIELVEHIAKLAKLEFTDSEKVKLSQELSQIMAYIEKLNEIDTNHVEPLSHTTEMANSFRKDEIATSLEPDIAVGNAPSRFGNFFKVPKVIK
jgi:aspartyl-tRNA(Asn)/glutamyl-tRNA(Gln) amidotransferase subunit C